MTYTDPMLPRRLAALHQDVLEFFARVESLLAQADPHLEDTKNRKKATQALIDLVTEARTSVQNLELRMAIIAPMKAGKSTIVNSLVGYDLVPSRAAAMTTLPTEIVLSQPDDRLRPTLQIDPRDHELFREAIRRIADELAPDSADPGYRDRMTGRYPYLADFLRQIQDDWLARWNRTTFTGLDDIRGALTAFNDLTRLAAGLRNPVHLADRLHAVPRIVASHRWAPTDDTTAFGHLVLVDTPGPDEANSGLRLSDVLRQQLDKCSVILVVLDFTKLNSTAATTIKDTMEPALAVIRRDQLFAVVNKVDQRRQGDMKRDELRRFVIDDLRLVDGDASDRVFELVAIRALQAVRCLDEVEAAEATRPGSFQPRSGPATRALYELIYTIEAEEELGEATTESVRRLAEKARSRSGLDDFLRQAIATLRTQAGSRVMQNALRRTVAGIVGLANEVQLRRGALKSSREAVATEIELLDNDLRRIGEIREELDSNTDVADQLRSDVDKILRGTRGRSLRAIRDIEVTDKPAGIAGEARLISQALRPNQQVPAVDAVEFDTVEDAQAFLSLLTRPVIESIDEALKAAQSTAARTFVERINSEVDRHGARLQPVLEEAHRRLRTQFRITLDVPPAELSDDTEDWAAIPLRSEQRTIEILVEKTLRRRVWYKVWIGWGTFREQHREEQQKSFHRIGLDDVRERMIGDLDRKIEAMREEFHAYLTSELSRHVENYYAQLRRYLQRYRDALAESLKDRERKRESLGEWEARVGRFHEELRAETLIAEDFLDGLQPITSLHGLQ
ncbi:dynamin family protein [Embleya sp. NPDC050154]|uniref:dynamin family protein n=1 Tax=unclassified Embleya TaxID=2699296 RepID=UPI0037B706C0